MDKVEHRIVDYLSAGGVLLSTTPMRPALNEDSAGTLVSKWEISDIESGWPWKHKERFVQATWCLSALSDVAPGAWSTKDRTSQKSQGTDINGICGVSLISAQSRKY